MTAAAAGGRSVLLEWLGGRLVRMVDRPARGRSSVGPTVLLLGGCGVPSAVWDDVDVRLPASRVVRLDRPGFGTPWPGHLPRLAEEVATLTALLERTGPAVLVAHSMAGPHAEAVARRVPGAVTGLVMVDASVEWGLQRGSARLATQFWHGAALVGQRAVGTRPGAAVGAAAGWLGARMQTRREPPSARRAFREAYADPAAVAATVAEQAAYADQLAELEQLRRKHPWPGTPTVVLTAGLGARRGWLADQRRLADLLGGAQVVLEDSRHLVMLDHPEVVADAVGSLTAPVVETEQGRREEPS